MILMVVMMMTMISRIQLLWNKLEEKDDDDDDNEEGCGGNKTRGQRATPVPSRAISQRKNLPKMQLIARRRPAIRHMLHSHGQKNFTQRSKTGFFVICANKCLFLERLTSAGILLSNNTTFLTAFNGQIFYQSSKYQAIWIATQYFSNLILLLPILLLLLLDARGDGHDWCLRRL